MTEVNCSCLKIGCTVQSVPWILSLVVILETLPPNTNQHLLSVFGMLIVVPMLHELTQGFSIWECEVFGVEAVLCIGRCLAVFWDSTH